MIKGQDILLMLRLMSLWRSDAPLPTQLRTEAWQGWETGDGSPIEEWHWNRNLPGFETHWRGLFTVRQLASDTGISKSQVSLSLQRCLENGLAFSDRKTALPRANSQALLGVIVHAARYLFPVKKGALARGIPTAMSAPILSEDLLTAGEQMVVWPDALGKSHGQIIEPIAPSVSHAVKRDGKLYAMLALTDSLRIGMPRERKLAESTLRSIIELPEVAKQ